MNSKNVGSLTRLAAFFLAALLCLAGAFQPAMAETDLSLDEILEKLESDETLGMSLPSAYRISVSDEELDKNEALPEEWLNVLLLGVDDRADGKMGGRTDTMLLVSVNTKTNEIKMTSFLRDMYVEIPGLEENNRLNVCNVFGGPNLLMKTLNRTFDMNIDSYIMVDFTNFGAIIDAIGGVDLYVTDQEVDYINYYVQLYLEENEGSVTNYTYKALSTSQGNAVIHLDGMQSVAYARNRYIGSDFTRTERQRKLIMAIFDSVTNATMDEVVALIPVALASVNTDLTLRDLLSVCIGLLTNKDVSFDSHAVPAENTYTDETIRNMSVLVPDYEANTTLLHEFIYGVSSEA